jgi:hypothetical protein
VFPAVIELYVTFKLQEVVCPKTFWWVEVESRETSNRIVGLLNTRCSGPVVLIVTSFVEQNPF